MEDGIYLIKPPRYLVELGIEEEGVYWKLNTAMYGLRKAPKKWEETRDTGLNTMKVQPKEDGQGILWVSQCPQAKKTFG